MGPEPPATDIENGKLYTGSCHCGVVTMALKAKGPLDEEVEIIGECDCSICARVRQSTHTSLIIITQPFYIVFSFRFCFFIIILLI